MTQHDLDLAPQHGRHRHRWYAMDCEEFDRLWMRAGGKCEICRVSWRFASSGQLHIDHDPNKGDWAVRGLLCSRCNTMLGTPGRLAWPEVDSYLADPWRTSRPEPSQHRIDLSALRDFDEVCIQYREAVTERLRIRRLIVAEKRRRANVSRNPA